MDRAYKTDMSRMIIKLRKESKRERDNNINGTRDRQDKSKHKRIERTKVLVRL